MTPSPLQRLVNPLVNPAVFDFWAGMINPVWSWNRRLARIVERRPESADAVTLVLKPNRHVGSFEPGQHVNLTADVNGRRITRSYSLTGLPRRDGRISVTVKQVPGGVLSTHLCREARVGDVVELGPAFGELAIPAARQAHRQLFLAAGSGITPLMGLTRALAAAGFPGDVTLLYWVRTRAELCFVRELRALAADSSGRFRVRFVLTRQEASLPDECNGRISEALLRQQVPDLAERHVSCCGPAGFVSAALALAGGSGRSFQAESFTPPSFGSDAAGTVQVHLSRTGRTLEVPAGVSLLAALETQGLQPEYGCRMGICNTCACGKSAGTTQDMSNGDISTEPESALRLCISRATTDVTLDL